MGGYYRDLVAQDTSGTGERYSTYTVSGVIANTGPEDAVEVSVTVTLYDTLGRVIGTRPRPEYDVIPTGGQSPFVVELTPAGGPVTRFRVDALGRRMPTNAINLKGRNRTPWGIRWAIVRCYVKSLCLGKTISDGDATTFFDLKKAM